jgi:hypothetical protein
MTTKLERLLDRIHPSRTIDEISRRVDRAIESFPVRKSSVSTYSEFEDLLGRFCAHIMKRVLSHPDGELSEADATTGQILASEVLTKIYGSSGHHAAFEMARSGTGGGLYGVLKELGKHMAEDFARRGIGARVSEYWDSLTTEEKITAGEEYVKRYRRLIPPELLEQGAVRLRGYLWKTLEEHPWVLHRLRQMGGSR